MTTRALCFVAAIATLPAHALVPAEVSELDDFGKAAATALDTAGRLGERAIIDWWRPLLKKGFGFPSKSPGGFDTVECERVQELHLVANSSEVMKVNLGACKREAKRVRDLAAGAGEASVKSLETTLKGAPPESLAKLRPMLAHGKVMLAGGMMTGYHFTIMWVGHGVGFVHAAVVYDPARDLAFIVMADVSQLCGHNSPTPNPKPAFPTVFCPDTGKALLDVAADLAKRVR